MSALRGTLPLIGVCALVGCASVPSPRDRAEGPSRGDVGAPAIVGETRNGMEVRWWLADDTTGRVGALLSPYQGNAVSIDGDRLAALRASGLRVVAVPAEEAGAVAGSMERLGTRERSWLGVTGAWAEVYRGRRVGPGVPVRAGGRRVRLERGLLRVLARVWVARTLDGPLLRASFATQNVEGASDSALGSVFSAPSFETPIERGTVLPSASFGVTLDPAYVLFVTCAGPGEEWEPAGHSPAGEERADGGEDSTESDATFTAPPGPPSVRTLTLGEVLMSVRPEETGGRTVRAVMMVVPRLPGAGRLGR